MSLFISCFPRGLTLNSPDRFTKCGYNATATDIELRGTAGTSAGGYLDFILKYAAQHLFGILLTDQELDSGSPRLDIKLGRNADFKEYTLLSPTSQPLLKFARAYGFRNIQNLVRKLKIKRTRGDDLPLYHFVEVMACPSGCINGGGQLKSDTNKMEWNVTDAVSMNALTKEWIQKAEGVYKSSTFVEGPLENTAAALIYE